MKLSQAVGALAALAQESRLKVFRLLVRAGLEGLPAGTISERLGIPPATLSFHLNLLTRARLITAQRNGRSIIYALRVEGIRTLLEFLVADCCKGRSDLCAPALNALKCAGATQGCRG